MTLPDLDTPKPQDFIEGLILAVLICMGARLEDVLRALIEFVK